MTPKPQVTQKIVYSLTSQWTHFIHIYNKDRCLNAVKVGASEPLSYFILFFFPFHDFSHPVLCCTWLHSVTHTLVRTPLDDGSASRRDTYLTTQQSQESDNRAPGGIRTRNPSKRAPQTVAFDRASIRINIVAPAKESSWMLQLVGHVSELPLLSQDQNWICFVLMLVRSVGAWLPAQTARALSVNRPFVLQRRELLPCLHDTLIWVPCFIDGGHKPCLRMEPLMGGRWWFYEGLFIIQHLYWSSPHYLR